MSIRLFFLQLAAPDTINTTFGGSYKIGFDINVQIVSVSHWLAQQYSGVLYDICAVFPTKSFFCPTGMSVE